MKYLRQTRGVTKIRKHKNERPSVILEFIAIYIQRQLSGGIGCGQQKGKSQKGIK